jgi:hypothetical protein
MSKIKTTAHVRGYLTARIDRPSLERYIRARTSDLRGMDFVAMRSAADGLLLVGRLRNIEWSRLDRWFPIVRQLRDHPRCGSRLAQPTGLRDRQARRPS